MSSPTVKTRRTPLKCSAVMCPTCRLRRLRERLTEVERKYHRATESLIRMQKKHQKAQERLYRRKSGS